MKNRNVFLFLCGLALTLTMYNCQRVDEPLPTGPNAELLKGFDAIKMPALDLVKPESVVSTPSALLPAAIKLDFRNGLSGTNGQLPAEFKKATDALSGALSADDLALLSELNPSVVNSLMAGGAMPDNLKKVVERAESSPSLSAYLTKAVLPTVQEIKPVAEVELKEEATTASNARTAASSNCKAQAQAAYEAKLEQLRQQRRQQLAAAQAQNAQAVADATAAATDCKNNVSYAAERAAAQQAANQAIASINSSNYPAYLKNLLIFLTAVRFYAELNAINQLEANDRRVCDQVRITAIIAASSALSANRTTIQDNFDASVEQAKAERAAFIANCQYQQGQGL